MMYPPPGGFFFFWSPAARIRGRGFCAWSEPANTMTRLDYALPSLLQGARAARCPAERHGVYALYPFTVPRRSRAQGPALTLRRAPYGRPGALRCDVNPSG